MFYDIALITFLLSLIIFAAFIFRHFLVEKDETPKAALDININQEQAMFSDNHESKPRKRNNSLLWPFAGTAVVIFILAQNQDAISSMLSTKSGPLQSTPNVEKRQTISPANIYGHAIVDGVNWFKIVATSSEGVPFEGWINEMAIHATPPKENKTADALMQKLGLSTAKERIDSIKSLKKVGSALKDSLRSVRPPEN